MNEQLKKYIDPIKNFWNKMTRRAKAILLASLGGVVLLAIILGVLMNRTQYSVLYAGMNSDEAQQVMTELQKLDVPYKSSNGTIYVAKDQENSVRMQLSNEGYPKSVPNYDFFTGNVGVMTTDDERKIIEQYQLQERLQAVIRTLSPVDTDYVTISIPEGGTYAWDDNKQAATASVTIHLKDGQSLAAQQVNGIKQLVAKSVPNLSTDNVSVINSETGAEFSTSTEESSTSLQITLSEFKLKIEKEYENNVESKILSLLSQAYGKGNISASVKSKMDLDKKIQDIVTYTPSSSGGNTGVVSQSQEEHVVAQQGTSSGSVVGVQPNADTTTTYPGVSVNGNVITTKDSKTYSYLVSQVEEQIQSDAAALDDLTVAVVVNTNSMTPSQKQEVTTLVANAAAVDPSKVAVMAVPLNPNSTGAASPTAAFPQILLSNPLILAAGAAALALLILLIVLLAARRRRKQQELLENLQPIAPMPLQPEEMPVALEEEAPSEEADTEEEVPEEEEEAEEEEEETETPESDAEEVEQEDVEEEEKEPKESIEEIRNAMNGKSNELKSDLQEFASRNPEIAAQLIRSWLRGDDSKHG